MKNRFLLPRAYPLVDRPQVQCHCSFQELCRLGTQGPIVTILSFSITETNEVAVFFLLLHHTSLHSGSAKFNSIYTNLGG